MNLITSSRQLVSNLRNFFAPGGYGFKPPSTWGIDWFQRGYRIPAFKEVNAAVEASVSAISQTVACMPLLHYRKRSDGTDELVKNSPFTQLMRNPNQYQTRADFMLNLIRQELLAGNGLAVAIRNRATDEIIELHNAPHSAGGYPGIYVADDGSVYYSISPHSLMPDSTVDATHTWRSRDVLHIRLHTPVHPLIGETPIKAAALAIATGNAISGHNAAFFGNMSRPSGVLMTPKRIHKDTLTKLKHDWEAMTSGENSGRTAVLMEDMKWQALTMNSVDAELIEVYRLSVADIARVFRVPLSIIGELGGATYNNTEVLINTWLATGLTYMIEHIEIALDKLFGFDEDQFMAFDVDYLLRTDFATRIDGLTRAITGGLLSPNEARAKEGLPPVKSGDEPRLQAQVVPLSAALPAPSAPSAPVNTPSAPPKKSVAEYREMLRKKVA